MAYLAGGLGNQLFMASAAYAWSVFSDTNLKISESRIRGRWSHADSRLGSLSSPLASAVVPQLPLAYPAQRLARALIRRPADAHLGKLQRVPDLNLAFRLDPRIMTGRAFGYFIVKPHQTAVWPKLLLDAYPAWEWAPAEPTEWFSSLYSEAAVDRPLCVHVRRGDYRLVAQEAGLLGLPYYQTAVSVLLGTTGSRPVWIFSDEPEEGRKIGAALGLRDWRVIEPPVGSSAAESLVLMSAGAGLVLANSTFSCWSAYLSGGSPVCYPEPWHPGSSRGSDLRLDHWTPVESAFELA